MSRANLPSANLPSAKPSSANGPTSDLPKPGVAAVLSFVLPGVGQFYNGCFLRGIFWLVVTPGLWLGSAGWLGWLCHLVAAYTAHHYARKRWDRATTGA